MAIFWVVASFCDYQGDHCPDDEGSMYLWSAGKLLPDYLVLQPTREPSSAFLILAHCSISVFQLAIKITFFWTCFMFITSVHYNPVRMHTLTVLKGIPLWVIFSFRSQFLSLRFTYFFCYSVCKHLNCMHLLWQGDYATLSKKQQDEWDIAHAFLKCILRNFVCVIWLCVRYKFVIKILTV
jgi:hypothetical protein